MEKHQVFVFGHYAGVVFGTGIDETGDDERLLARFDFGQCFGSVLNRYCAEAVIDHPLSPLWYRSAKERLELSGITGRKTAKTTNFVGNLRISSVIIEAHWNQEKPKKIEVK